MALKSEYAVDAIEWLATCMSTGIDWTETRLWMAQHELPLVIAKLVNGAAAKQGEVSLLAQEYLVDLHEMMGEGELRKTVKLILNGPQNVHNAHYYLMHHLDGGSLLQELAKVAPSRWGKERGFIGEVKSK